MTNPTDEERCAEHRRLMEDMGSVYDENLLKAAARAAQAAKANCHCGKPEVDHIWISESELNEWRPKSGFKKNSCARKPSSAHTEDAPDLVFKVWSPPEDPCDEEYMEDISS